jgi:hypothetical protein
MTIANEIYESLNEFPFSYGETVAKIIENRGKSISAPTNEEMRGISEDFVFPDNSILRVTDTHIKVLSMLQE